MAAAAAAATPAENRRLCGCCCCSRPRLLLLRKSGGSRSVQPGAQHSRSSSAGGGERRQRRSARGRGTAEGRAAAAGLPRVRVRAACSRRERAAFIHCCGQPRGRAPRDPQANPAGLHSLRTKEGRLLIPLCLRSGPNPRMPDRNPSGVSEDRRAGWEFLGWRDARGKRRSWWGIWREEGKMESEGGKASGRAR